MDDGARGLAAPRRPGGRRDERQHAVYEDGWGEVGAIVMGRNMFGGGPGPWGDEPWKGWWGDDPPFHMPVFVLTHHAREPLECAGGTTFAFVTDGPAAALEAAHAVAGGASIAIAGGASVARQYLAAGLVDEVTIHLVAAFLGAGVRLFDEPALAAAGLEQVRVVEAPGVTHLTYRVRSSVR